MDARARFFHKHKKVLARCFSSSFSSTLALYDAHDAINAQERKKEKKKNGSINIHLHDMSIAFKQ